MLTLNDLSHYSDQQQVATTAFYQEGRLDVALDSFARETYNANPTPFVKGLRVRTRHVREFIYFTLLMQLLIPYLAQPQEDCSESRTHQSEARDVCSSGIREDFRGTIFQK